MNGQLDRLKSFLLTEEKNTSCEISGFLSGLTENGKSFCLYNHAFYLSGNNKKTLVVDSFESDFQSFLKYTGEIPNINISKEYQIIQVNRSLSLLRINKQDLNNSYLIKKILKNKLYDKEYNRVLVNSVTGSPDSYLSTSLVSDEIFIVCTSEPVSIIDAYAIIKILLRKGYSKKIKIVINKLNSTDELLEATHNLKNSVMHFLKFDLTDIFAVPLIRSVEINNFGDAERQYFSLEKTCLESNVLLNV